MYLPRTPAIVKPFLKELIWNVPGPDNAVYLTFDDGPDPDVTPWVLDTLARFDAKASFFCLGRNAAAHPSILQRIRDEGHTVGNHTWEHLNGWKTSRFTYLRSVLRSQQVTGGSLFRPPYGRITRGQSRGVRCRFDIVMWDVLSGDFDTAIDGERCLSNVLDNARPGSIIVFHDSTKAAARSRCALPLALEHFRAEGYAMRALADRLRV